MDAMQNKAAQAASYLKGIASPHRLLILCELAQGEKSVSDLIESTGLAQSSMSQHLNKLKAENIVSFRRDHRTLYYSICNETTLQIMNILYQEFCQEETKP
ncbi:ArsR/SmtB family transcription factor [Marinomonas epiphytica]